jgi:RNA polymerase sigma-70 factor, ECF subfamily
MLRAWRSRSALRDTDVLRAWLFTIVRREHARLYERKQLPVVNVDVLTLDEGNEAATSYDEDLQLSELRGAILKLSDEYRIPLVMQVIGGFTSAEIAQEMDLTIPAVLTRLFRARNQLRELYGAGPSDPKRDTGSRSTL